MFAEKQQLKYGIVQGGKVHKSFTPKLLTIGGEIAALEHIETAEPMQSETAQSLLEATAYLSQQVEIEGVDVTPALLLTQLASEDFTIINDALAVLQKKRCNATPMQNK